MVWLSLLHKGADSLLHALRVIKRVEDVSLESHTVALAEVLILLDCLFGGKQGRERLVGDFLCEFDHLRVQVCEGVHFAHDAQLVGAFGRNKLRSKHITICIHSSGNAGQSVFTNAYL